MHQICVICVVGLRYLGGCLCSPKFFSSLCIFSSKADTKLLKILKTLSASQNVSLLYLNGLFKKTELKFQTYSLFLSGMSLKELDVTIIKLCYLSLFLCLSHTRTHTGRHLENKLGIWRVYRFVKAYELGNYNENIFLLQGNDISKSELRALHNFFIPICPTIIQSRKGEAFIWKSRGGIHNYY